MDESFIFNKYIEFAIIITFFFTLSGGNIYHDV